MTRECSDRLPVGWREYGNEPDKRFWLLRNKRTRRARYWDRITCLWVGPEQSNIVPAVAWALAHGRGFRLVRMEAA